MSTFDPDSPNFNVDWTGATADAVSFRETWNLVEGTLFSSAKEEKLRFLRILSHLTWRMESWNRNLDILGQQDAGWTHFKHCICKHWVAVARYTAKMIPIEPLPMGLLLINNAGNAQGLRFMGHSYPSEFDGLRASLRRMGCRPMLDVDTWLDVILSLDWKEAGASTRRSARTGNCFQKKQKHRCSNFPGLEVQLQKHRVRGRSLFTV